jgi:phosphoglycolate phosphatase
VYHARLMAPRLVLFDIDGTLIRDDGAAREAFEIALRQAYGFERGASDYDFSGRTDPQIALMILEDAGYERIGVLEQLPRLWEVYLAELRVRALADRIHVLPGVHEFVASLHSDSRFALGLLTGNISDGARIKLTPGGLNRFFPFGAFGSDSMHREDLPPIALERAAAAYAIPFEARDAVIVGDSIFDVRCGIPHEVRTIAVASGRTPRATLEAENPAFLFDSLEDTDALIDAILS